MASGEIITISLEEFYNISTSEAQQNETIRDRIYTNEIADIFIKDGVEDDRNEANLLAMDFLKGGDGYQIFSNSVADQSEYSIGNKTGSLIESYNSIVKDSFLLIKAPTHKTMSKEQENDMRESQYKHFCKVYPGLCDAKNEQVQKEVVTIDTRQNLMDEVEKFLLKSNKTITSVIVFNGHGGEDGLYLHEGGKGEYVELDTFIMKVQSQRQAQIFPITVNIIFAQCWGHKHNGPKDDPHMYVTCFTTKDQTSTHNIKTKDGFKHHQLQKYAIKMDKEEQDKKQMDIEDEGISLPG